MVQGPNGHTAVHIDFLINCHHYHIAESSELYTYLLYKLGAVQMELGLALSF